MKPKSILGVEKVTSFRSFGKILIFPNENISSIIRGIMKGGVVIRGGWSQIQTQSKRLEQNWEEIHY